jgi:hypothetical protein
VRYILFIIFFLTLTSPLLGQQTAGKISSGKSAAALSARQVSGIVQDSTGEPVTGATIKIISAKDSLLTSSDKDGIFIFGSVKMANFILTASEIGFKTTVRKYFNNDQSPKIILEPIIISSQSYQLKQVVVNGTPSVIYKTDTVEYRAGDYKVPEYATVDELLKKMEGMEVGADGSLAHQGQAVVKAKLNGREFGGGSVSQAIQNLPASIVDKIQIVDDYGDQAARTGIKDGAPVKVLNITTKKDRSVGTIARLVSQEGNNGRYNEQVSLQNINANRVINLSGNITSTVNGVASSNSTSTMMPPAGAPFTGGLANYSPTSATGAGAPGTTHSGAPTFSYTDNWGSKLIATGSYVYNYNNVNSVSENYGQINSSIGSSNFNNKSTVKNNNQGHAVKFQLEYNIDKTNYLQINPTFNHKSIALNSNILTDNLNYFTTGFEHPVVGLTTNQPATNNDYGITALYVHVFRKAGRNFSIQTGFNQSNNQINGDKSADYRYYLDTTLTTLIKDSLSHLLTFKTSNSKIYRSVITYIEPISLRSKLEFTAQIRNAVHNNEAVSDTVLADGQLKELTRLKNVYQFSFLETRVTIDYHYTGQKSNLSVGATVVPTNLSGNQIDNNTNNYVYTSRSNLKVIPVFRYAYAWSSTEKFQIAYSGTTNEPNFQQIQPFTDRSDPNNIITGNPNLKPTFVHNVKANYDSYFPNSRFNLSFGIDGTLYDNQVATDIAQVTFPISGTSNSTINQISFANVSGDKVVNGNYTITKQLNNRNYYLALNGNIIYNHTNAISNDLPYHTTAWVFVERFGPQITLNNTKVIIKPYVGYEIDKSTTTTLNAVPSTIKTVKLAIDGQTYLPSNFQVHYSASKNYISGFTNNNINPFVINAGFEKRFLKTHNLAVTFDVFDLLHQNSFIQQTVTPQYTSYTLSNTLSRYFLVGLKLNLQKWGGTPTRRGQTLKRRGDGSFY